MRRLMAGLGLLALGCGGASSECAGTAGPGLAPQQAHVRGLPGRGTWRAAVLAGPGVADLELYGLWYPLAALGWRVTVATPVGGAHRGAAGLPVPNGRTYATLDPAKFDALYVPGGAPAEAAAVARAFVQVGTVLITTTAGAKALAAGGLQVAVASDDEMVQQHDGVWSAARPGDLPRLAHAVTAYAEDTLRAAHRATGGVPP